MDETMVTAPVRGLPRYIVLQRTLGQEIRSGAYTSGQRFLTEREICARFGVSRTTAVRALTDLVHEGLIVRHPGRGTFVAEKFDASPQLPATGRRRALGLVCQHMGEGNSIVRGISHVCRETGYDVLLFESEASPELEAHDLQRVRTAGIAGLILYPVNGYTNVALLEAIRRDGIPTVMVDRYYPMVPTDAVLPDNIGLASQVTAHLVGLGHRRIALLGSDESLTTSLFDRLAGFRSALRAHAVPFEPDIMLPLPFVTLPADERRALLATWLSSTSPPTAMLAMNGTAFATAAADLLEMGQPVDGLALACMDDCASDTWLMPAIVSAHMPWYEMGCEATWLVIQRIEGDTQRPIRHITLPIELVVGGTGVRGTARSKVDRA